MPNVFASAHPLVAHKLSRMRNKDIEPKKFRELVREIAALLCYEATSDLLTVPRQVETPLATMTGSELQEKIGLVPILRAGPWNGRRHLGVDARRRSVAYRTLSR